VVSCLVRDAVQKPCAPSSRHSWLDVEQGGSFIIGFLKGMLLAARQCNMLGAWCRSLLGVVSAVLAFLIYD
jgi:hypothetical protein